jgi:hypothetical protein
MRGTTPPSGHYSRSDGAYYDTLVRGFGATHTHTQTLDTHVICRLTTLEVGSSGAWLKLG